MRTLFDQPNDVLLLLLFEDDLLGSVLSTSGSSKVLLGSQLILIYDSYVCCIIANIKRVKTCNLRQTNNLFNKIYSFGAT